LSGYKQWSKYNKTKVLRFEIHFYALPILSAPVFPDGNDK